MVYVIKAFDKNQRFFVPYIISFIKNADTPEVTTSNIVFKTDTLDLSNLIFGVMKNMTKEQEEALEKEYMKNTEQQTE
jgi:hypothetical protein